MILFANDFQKVLSGLMVGRADGWMNNLFLKDCFKAIKQKNVSQLSNKVYNTLIVGP